MQNIILSLLSNIFRGRLNTEDSILRTVERIEIYRQLFIEWRLVFSL